MKIQEKEQGEKAAVFEYDESYLYDALASSTDEYLYVCNMKTATIRYTKAMLEEFDLPGEIVKDPINYWKKIIHKDDWERFYESNIQTFNGELNHHIVEYRAKNRRGEWVWLRCRGTVVKDDNGENSLFAGFISNLGRKNKVDHQTGLFNKFEFQNQIEAYVENTAVNSFGLMILGIDNFKNVNELYDREFGDKVLRVISQRISSLIPGHVSLYRLEGDEFGILLRGVKEEESLAFYQKIQHAFDRQQSIDGKKYSCTVSAGCSVYPRHGDNFLDLLRCAEYSLNYSKTHGKNRITVFSDNVLKSIEKKSVMTELLRESIEHDFEGFCLHYQPQVLSESGTLKGAEALLRWHCDRFGDVSPVEFIPLLEDSGLIRPVGKWVLQNAIKASKPWVARTPDFCISVNVSYLQLIQSGNEAVSDIVPFLQNLLEREQFPAENLIVELTETQIAQNIRDVRQSLDSLRQMGLRIAMDDFGTGYSSLGILKKVPIDVVKVDRTFISEIGKSEFDNVFIQFIVALCHQAGITVCQEGVETKGQYGVIKKLNADFIQGYYFGRPMPREDITRRYFS